MLGTTAGTEVAARRLPLGSYAGDVMLDDLVALTAAVIVIPIIVVFGLFRLAALKRARDLKA